MRLFGLVGGGLDEERSTFLFLSPFDVSVFTPVPRPFSGAYAAANDSSDYLLDDCLVAGMSWLNALVREGQAGGPPPVAPGLPSNPPVVIDGVGADAQSVEGSTLQGG